MKRDRFAGMRHIRVAALLAAFASLVVSATLQAAPAPRVEPPIGQIIVKLRPASGAMTAEMQGDRRAMTAARFDAVIRAAAVPLLYQRAMSGHAHVLTLPRAMNIDEAYAVAHRIRELADVEYAQPDRWMFAQALPNDPYFTQQWNLQDPSGGSSYAGAANLPGAWAITTGASRVVVAVIDTGVLNHPDLKANLIGGASSYAGYDMISYVSAAGSGQPVSNDGNGRDSNPTDPGDWMAITNPYNPYYGYAIWPSSWHGTHVAGTIAAVNNNAVGVAGIAPRTKILAVRALGSAGGLTSDIVDGIAWAAGATVPGVPANTHPAQVINLSLGGGGSCATDYATQGAIDTAVSNGATLVVAAGNDDADAANYTPASCNGVITVAAVSRYGSRAWYSNHDVAGSYVALAAPGGDTTSFAQDGIISTLNNGTKGATSNYTYAWYQGTSMATPHVSGVVALMLAANPHLTDGSIAVNTVPGIIKSRLQATARAFPGICGGCGAGVLDAAAAVANVGTPPVVTAAADQTLVTPGTLVNLIGTATDNNGAPTHEWSQTAGTNTVTLGDAGALDTAFTAPANDDTLTFRLSASDDLLLTSTASVTVKVRTPPLAPSNLTATAATNGHIRLAWSDNSGNEEGFQLWRDSGGGAALLTTTAANAVGYEDGAVTVGATYTYYVVAWNGFASPQSNTASAVAVQPRSSGGGGSGGFGAMEWLSLGAGAALLRRRRRTA